MKKNDTTDPTIDLDRPVWGAREFGRILNRSERQIHHLLEAGQLAEAVEKCGGVYVSTPRKLLKIIGIEA
jgi:hypothetical protein